MRTATIRRTTAETNIILQLNLDGSGKAEISTGCGFLDHMLTLFAVHSRFDLHIKADGDTYVDDHHTVEDVGIALGQAFTLALDDKKGICRYGSSILPMDETLILSAVDFSGRAYLGYSLDVPARKVGTFDTELTEEFFYGLVRNSNITLHLQKLAGTNSHHIIEGAFKSVARSFAAAVRINPNARNEIPSSKGVL